MIEIHFGKEKFTLDPLDSITYQAINSIDVTAQKEAAKEMALTLSVAELKTVIENLTNTCVHEPEFDKNGFNGFLPILINALLTETDKKNLLDKIFGQIRFKGDLGAFKFGPNAQQYLTVIYYTVKKQGELDNKTTYMDKYERDFFLFIQPVLREIPQDYKASIDGRTIKPFLIHQNLNTLKQQNFKQTIEGNLDSELAKDFLPPEKPLLVLALSGPNNPVQTTTHESLVAPQLNSVTSTVESSTQSHIVPPETVASINEFVNSQSPTSNTTPAPQTDATQSAQTTTTTPSTSASPMLATSINGFQQEVNKLKHENANSVELDKAVTATQQVLNNEKSVQSYISQANKYKGTNFHNLGLWMLSIAIASILVSFLFVPTTAIGTLAIAACGISAVASGGAATFCFFKSSKNKNEAAPVSNPVQSVQSV